MPTFTVSTLGCKVNQYDAGAISAALAAVGFRPAAPGATATADLVVINTCCVTTAAMRKSRQAIRRAVRASPNAAVLVTGCYSDYDAWRIEAILAALGGPDRPTAVVGHHGDLAASLDTFLSVLGRPGDAASIWQAQGARAGLSGDDLCMSAYSAACRDGAPATPSTIRARRKTTVKKNTPRPRGLGPIKEFPEHQRAFVKVQDGCDAFCAYCIVPYTRVNVWSRTYQSVLDECRHLVAAGHKEIVLCGVFLSAYGRATAIRRRWDRSPSALPGLLRRLAAIDGVWRVRLSSLEPADLTDELLAVYTDLPNVAPHFHLPLQSGSQHILRRMNRQYTPRAFRRTVDRLRTALDRPAVTTDVIVGFPGESNADFAATLALAADAGFAKIHAFPFSAVEGTAAWTYRHEAPAPEVTRARMAELAVLERDLAADYRRQFVGQTLEGLVEQPRGPEPRLRRAMTDRYLTVRFAPAAAETADLTGEVVRLHVLDVSAEGLRGTLCHQRPPVASPCPGL